ncbi:MAG: hypothetical protein AUK43_00435 [Oscillatoriales cyanobacterium CG2_30_40_61]|nr:MAG: hypothetical protein AUK43_00435 [Oscillatoriales cyanobacterium CG2_30_40_61]
MKNIRLGKYLSLNNFCICTNTYQKYSDKINPYPNSAASIQALKDLNYYIIDPVIDYFGLAKFKLTYGFCSHELRVYLDKKDPITGLKNGRVAPKLDQHIAHEVKKNGEYYCKRLGAACDFLILDLDSDQLVDWILKQQLPFDSLYFYGKNRPIHISYGPQHKRNIWTFSTTGKPTQKGIELWIKTAKEFL